MTHEVLRHLYRRLKVHPVYVAGFVREAEDVPENRKFPPSAKGDIDVLACWEPFITKGIAAASNQRTDVGT